MRIEPAGHRVLVKPDPLSEIEAKELAQYESLAKSGFEIADAKDRKRKEGAVSKGTIIDIGMNAWKAYDDGAKWAGIGDRVYFAKYGGTEIKENGETFRILNDEDVIAIIHDEVQP